MATTIRDKVLSALADIYDDPAAPGLDLGDGSRAATDQAGRDAEWAILMEAVADRYSNLRSATWWIDNTGTLHDGRWAPDLHEVLTGERIERIRALRAAHQPPGDPR